MHLQKYTDSSNWIRRYVLSKRYQTMKKNLQVSNIPCGKFGEHESCPRVSKGFAESNSSFLKAPETSQVLHIWMNALLTYGTSFTNNFETASQHNYFNVVVSIIITFKKHSE